VLGAAELEVVAAHPGVVARPSRHPTTVKRTVAKAEKVVKVESLITT
jgi:hypothetical protein